MRNLRKKTSLSSKLYSSCLLFAALMLLCPWQALAGQQQEGPPQGEPPAGDNPPVQGGDPQEQPAYQVVPSTLTLPPGTMVTVRVSQLLSSDQNKPGDTFGAELQNPLVVDGWVVARRGQTVLGRVAVAQKAGRVKGVSQLGVELGYLVLVDGQQVPIKTQLMQTSAGTSQGRDAQAIGTTTGLGAIIGAAAHGGEGAGIGAAAGAAAGIAGVLLTRGRPTLIPPEALLTFQTEFPVTFSTRRSQVAFRPVTQQDYEGGELRRRTDHFATYGPGYPPPPPYYCNYCYDYGYYPYGYYPPFFFGASFYRFGHGGFRH